MRKLEIKNFKAFKGSFSVELIEKNFLLYGDNGSGKSSIFEAMKVVFFKDRFESSISTAVTPEEYQQYINNLWAKFNNKSSNLNFELIVDDDELQNFDRSLYQVFMISMPDLVVVNELNLVNLLEGFYIDIPNTLQFCMDGFELIQEEVNKRLLENYEEISISIDPQDNFSIKIIDTRRGLETKSELKKFFNEGKINFIILHIIFSAITLSSVNGKEKILILDDFITSLDIANRTFLVKHMLKTFPDFRIFIFTHNITFFNLLKYIVNLGSRGNEWIYANIYEISDSHRLFVKDPLDTVAVIQQNYDALATQTGGTIDQIGNNIRKKFEVLLYEFSKALVVGGVEESNVILDRIISSKSLFAKPGGKNVYNLIDEIEGILASGVPMQLLHLRLRTKIDSYKQYNLVNLRAILLDLKLYRKLTMHPMSHGVNGMPSFTQAEIEKSLELLAQMEATLSKLIDQDVASAV
jgi:hypothetical protein